MLKLKRDIYEIKKESYENQITLDSLKGLPRYLERTQPLLTHLQLCEGLEAVVGDLFPSRLRKFQKLKFKELQDFNMDFRTVVTDLKNL